MLLDPLEEELHLPAAPVELSNDMSGQREVVGQEREAPLGFGIDVFDAAKMFGVIEIGVEAREADGLIASHPGRIVEGM